MQGTCKWVGGHQSRGPGCMFLLGCAWMGSRLPTTSTSLVFVIPISTSRGEYSICSAALRYLTAVHGSRPQRPRQKSVTASYILRAASGSGYRRRGQGILPYQGIVGNAAVQLGRMRPDPIIGSSPSTRRGGVHPGLGSVLLRCPQHRCSTSCVK